MRQPRNLTIIIMDNGLYQITGKQPAATARSANIVAIARGAGIAESQWLADDSHVERHFARRFDQGGPVLLAAKIDDRPGEAQTPRDPALIRRSFMQGLGTARNGALGG
jgi:thiamine pyrophosphate-dependent acetolactate synthase large subunit-like protein